MSVVLTDEDYKQIGNELYLDPSHVRQMMRTASGMESFKVDQLKKIIKILRNKPRCYIRSSGRKREIINAICATIGIAPSLDDPSHFHELVGALHQAIPSLVSSSSSSNNVIQPLLSGPSVPRPIMNSPEFLRYQDPFFEVIEQITSQHVGSREKHIGIGFEIKPDVLDRTKKPGSIEKIHVRFFNTTLRCEIQWTQDYGANVNNRFVDAPKGLRKVKSMALQNPFFAYHALDITNKVGLRNHFSACNARAVEGVIVIQFVRERALDELLAAIPLVEPKFSAAEEDEIMEVTAEVSLLCPLSICRILRPGRGKNCSHRKCFDLLTYLSYSRSQQVWNCPICQGQVPYQDLVEDALFQKILNSILDDKVVINPDGTWTSVAELSRAKSLASAALSSSSSLQSPPHRPKQEQGLINLEDQSVFPPSKDGTPTAEGDRSPGSALNSPDSSYPVQNGVIILDDD